MSKIDPKPTSSYAAILTMLENSDVVPALAAIKEGVESSNFLIQDLAQELRIFYPFLHGECSLGQHYDRYYREIEAPKTGLRFHDIRNQPRYKAVAERLALLPKGAKVVDYGCAEGSCILGYARDFPHLAFVGIDIAEAEVEAVKDNKDALARLTGIDFSNVRVYRGAHDDWPVFLEEELFDAAILGEVLEHVPEPWNVLKGVESHLIPDALVITTTPLGPWEMKGCRDQGASQWPWRAHVWHLDGAAMHAMVGREKDFEGLNLIGEGQDRGHVIVSYRYSPISPGPQALDWRTKFDEAKRLPLFTYGVEIDEHDGAEVAYALSMLPHPPAAIRLPMRPISEALFDYLDAHPWIRQFKADEVDSGEFAMNFHAVMKF